MDGGLLVSSHGGQQRKRKETVLCLFVRTLTQFKKALPS